MELPSIKEYHLENYTVIGDRLCIRFNKGEDVDWAGRIIVQCQFPRPMGFVLFAAEEQIVQGSFIYRVQIIK
jgi:hypothetical protein